MAATFQKKLKAEFGISGASDQNLFVSPRERAAEMRRNVLRMDLGTPDGVNVAEELAQDRGDER